MLAAADHSIWAGMYFYTAWMKVKLHWLQCQWYIMINIYYICYIWWWFACEIDVYILFLSAVLIQLAAANYGFFIFCFLEWILPDVQQMSRWQAVNTEFAVMKPWLSNLRWKNYWIWKIKLFVISKELCRQVMVCPSADDIRLCFGVNNMPIQGSSDLPGNSNVINRWISMRNGCCFSRVRLACGSMCFRNKIMTRYSTQPLFTIKFEDWKLLALV